MITFGNRLKKLRIARGLTQDQLADEFNDKYGYALTKATISQYENNRRLPEITIIMNFKEYFNVSLDYLLCNDDYTIKEVGIKYDGNYINIEDIVFMVNNMATKNNIKLNGEILNDRQKDVLNNCLEIAIELLKREKTNN